MADCVYSVQRELNDFAKWVVVNGGYIHSSLIFTPGGEPFLRHLQSFSPNSSILKKIEISGPSGGTIHSSAPIPSSTPLLKCPHPLTLDYSKAGAHFSEKFKKAVNPRTTIYMFLCYQALLGEKSFWKPYIDILPQEFDTPLYFSPDDMDWLQGCNLGAAEVDARREVWRKEWELAVEVLRNEGVQTEDYTWELFLWAATVFTSRSFPGRLLKWKEKDEQRGGVDISTGDEEEDAPVLFPLIDSTNHYPRTKITWQPGATELSIISGEAIEGGGELLNNYGPKANEELLMGYGFTISGNPFDTVVLKFNPPLAPGQQAIRELQIAAYPPTDSPPGIHHLSLVPDSETNSLYPRSLLDIFQIITASPSDIPRLQSNPTAVSVSLRNTIATHNQLLLAMKRKVAGIVTGNQTLEREPVNSKQRSAKVYRDTQVSILSSAISESESVLKGALANANVIRLENALREQPFADAVEVCFGTKGEDDIRGMGMEDIVFVLYLCWKYIASSSSPSSSEWEKWFRTIVRTYGSPGDEDDVDEEAQQNYEDVFPAAAEAAEDVFGGDMWTAGMMAWGMKVYQMEGVGVGVGENAVWVICLEG
ncbi:hypothetical protein RUND412_003263 [Rhizina undulata]